MSFDRETKRACLKNEDSLEYTESGAVERKGIDNELLDANKNIIEMRDYDENMVKDICNKIYTENPKDAVYLAEKHPETMKELLPLIPEYSRWDYAVSLMLSKNKDVSKAATELVVNQIYKDMKAAAAQEGQSCLAKWLPSIQTKKPHQRKIVFMIEKEMGLSHQGYRKLLASLRGHLKTCSANS